ncbi:MAG: hypothetical protein ACFB03_19125 [Paracoccaceae bacterium]
MIMLTEHSTSIEPRRSCFAINRLLVGVAVFQTDLIIAIITASWATVGACTKAVMKTTQIDCEVSTQGVAQHTFKGRGRHALCDT